MYPKFAEVFGIWERNATKYLHEGRSKQLRIFAGLLPQQVYVYLMEFTQFLWIAIQVLPLWVLFPEVTTFEI